MKSELKVKIADIEEDGYDFHDSLDPNFFGLTADDHLHFIQPIQVNARLVKFEETIIANVEVAGRFASFCYRSFEPVERDWSTKFKLDFKVAPNAQSIDLADDVRQEVIVSLPLRVLCDTEEAKDKEEGHFNSSVDDSGEDSGPDTYRPFKNI